MGFIMDGLDAEAYDRKYTDRDLVKRIAGYFKPQTGRMIAVAFGITLHTVANMALPIYISRSLDRLQQAPESVNLVTTIITMIMLASVSWIANAVRGWLSS